MKLLVVEDEEKLARVVQQGLEEQGFVVDRASGGEDALEFASSGRYDAIVLDVMLPGKDGFEILRELRSQGDATPVLMLTARSSVEERVRGLNLGADDYLPKPFDFRELVSRIRAVARRPHTPPQTVLELADLSLDIERRTVSRGGRQVELTSREFALLEYLLRNKNHVMSRAMILDRVWRSDYDGGSNLVDVYVNYLRRKVDHDFTPKLIHTIRGVGYVVRAGAP